MGKQTPSIFITLLLLLLAILTEVIKGATSTSVKLFVFGDSYVDTGNFLNSEAYRPPSGITYPGKPSGRDSDGRVLTDFIASFLKIETPAPYAFINSSDLQYGINFAYGGTGIFNTITNGPNMSVQIDSFEQMIKQNVYNKSELASSVALVNAGGNDYTTLVLKNAILLPRIVEFTASLVKRLSTNLRRIHSLGVGKIAVTSLEPIGCVPVLAVVTFYQQCLDLLNMISENHNKLLSQAVQDLNKEFGNSAIVTLDMYNAILTSIDTMKKAHAANSTLMNPLKPCCEGLGVGKSCGSVGDNGEKNYKVCDNPELSFFWNSVHPSQNGWNAISKLLQPSLGPLIEKRI